MFAIPENGGDTGNGSAKTGRRAYEGAPASDEWGNYVDISGIAFMD